LPTRFTSLNAFESSEFASRNSRFYRPGKLWDLSPLRQRVVIDPNYGGCFLISKSKADCFSYPCLISGVRFVGRPPGRLVFVSPLERAFSGIFLPEAKFNLSFRVVLLNVEALGCLSLPLTVTDPALEPETLMSEKRETIAPV
jgi:hypothetical protein